MRVVDGVERAAHAVVELPLAGQQVEQLLWLVIEGWDGLEDAVGRERDQRLAVIEPLRAAGVAGRWVVERVVLADPGEEDALVEQVLAQPRRLGMQQVGQAVAHREPPEIRPLARRDQA